MDERKRVFEGKKVNERKERKKTVNERKRVDKERGWIKEEGG